MQFTAAIPTYNGGSGYLSKVLDALLKQKTSIKWELIVVDNNSKDDTKKLILKYKTKFKVPLRYVFEKQQGAAYARQRAVEEAKGQLVGFLDDDVVPASNWIDEAYRFGLRHPEAGAWGGQVHGKYEVEPPKGFERIAPFLAITERGNNEMIYLPSKKLLPPSASLVVKKNVWLKNVPKRLVITGINKINRATGEDIEALLNIQNSGWEIWYDPKMKSWHQIPKQRLEKEYLIKLANGIGITRHYIRMLRYKKWQRPFFTTAGVANDIWKLATYYRKHRKTIKTDIVSACEFEFLKSRLKSQFYFLKRQFEK